jgi:hypothetical protein
MINEAMYVLLEGVANAQDIDKAIKLGYNLETGPQSPQSEGSGLPGSRLRYHLEHFRRKRT